MEVKMPKFAQRVRELRTERNLTQREMGALLGKTDRHYQAIEAGHINVPALTLEKLADFFDVSTDYLLGRDDRRKP